MASRRVSVLILFIVSSAGCSSLPEVKHKWYSFPKEAQIGKPVKPYKTLGTVRSKVDYQSLDSNYDESRLCKNYFNAAVKKLVEYAKAKGADAVIDVQSVVFLMDGKSETYTRPECTDDGGSGQVLAQGIAVKWE